MKSLPPSEKLGRIVVAMSGGVDSSVAAALLKRQGHDVIGITLQLYDQGGGTARGKTCCAGQDIADARRVAETIGIPHYVLDYERRFREAVIDDFVDTYVAGETPVPCVRCNEMVKFGDLMAAAMDMGAEALATGHYIRRAEGAAGPQLHVAADASRDQSYFLFSTSPAQLARLRFPLGDFPKAETRALAAEFGLLTADKPDSQDICFVPSGHYADLVRKRRPDVAKPGDIVDLSGRVLGQHDGIVNFTVGQRRGIRLGGVDPLFVLRLDPAANRVVVGPRAALRVPEFALRAVNWLGDQPIAAEGEAIEVRVRSSQPLQPARLFAGPGGTARVLPDLPIEGVAPGQACAFYRGSRLLGGGWITASRARAAA
jgi:tRNA-specific 2-thiouridylase